MSVTSPADADLHPESRAPVSAGADEVVRLDNVSVVYRVPVQPVASLKEFTISLLRGTRGYRELEALKNASLVLQRGDVLGILGHNGAGKSTLLKTIARILRPTSGRVWVKGLVVPILQLGSGFHPELTGRENLYLNGTLLGHSRRDVTGRLSDIVEFAELGAFIDAPLRTYSSGMVGRLGFAVATAWKPDILVIDEALAVGDEAFQRKCAARISVFRQQGATMLIVAHSCELIQSICPRAIWVDHGVIRADGPSADVVEQYRRGMGLGQEGGQS